MISGMTLVSQVKKAGHGGSTSTQVLYLSTIVGHSYFTFSAALNLVCTISQREIMRQARAS